MNGVTERKHRHIVDKTRSLFLFSPFLSDVIGEEVLTSIHAINKISLYATSSLSPLLKLYDSIHDYSF